jgi:hypothetical protein
MRRSRLQVRVRATREWAGRKSAMQRWISVGMDGLRRGDGVEDMVMSDDVGG